MSPNFVKQFTEFCESSPSLSSERLDQELGLRLQVVRKKLGISQSYLADMLHRDQTAISKMECGARQVSVPDFLMWCRALDLPLEQVVELLKIGPYKDE